MSRLHIAVDVDGVLADMVGRLLERLSAAGYCYAESEVKHFDFSRTFSPTALSIANHIMGEPGFAASLDWYQGARVFLSILQDLGAVAIATAPYKGSPTWAADRVKWLSSRVHPNDIISVPTPLKHLATQFADVLVEDRVETLEAWKKVRPDGLAILIDRPWNRVPAPYAVRVTKYIDAVDAVRSFKSRAA